MPEVGWTKLEKLSHLVWPEGVPSAPSIPGKPAVPAYTAPQPLTYHGIPIPPGWGFKVATDELTGQTFVVPVPPGTPGSYPAAQINSGTFGAPVQHTGTIAIPPTPPVQQPLATMLLDRNFGWNAEAFTVEQIQWGGAATFTTGPGTVGGMIGWSRAPSVDYETITHGLYFSSGMVQPIERGTLRDTQQSFSASDVFTLRVDSGVGVYKKNGTTFYTSSVTVQSFVGVQANFYAGEDVIYNLAVVNDSAVTGSEDPMTMDSNTSLLPLEGIASEIAGLNYSKAALMPLAGFANAGGSIIPAYGFSTAALAPLQGTAFLTAEMVFDSDSSLLPLDGIAAEEANWNYSKASLKPLEGRAYSAAVEGRVWIEPWLLAADSMIVTSGIAIVLDGRLGISGVIGFEVHASAKIAMNLGVESVWTATTLASAILDMRLGVRGAPGGPEKWQVWVMNQETGAASRYENFEFNSFAFFNGRYYGAKKDGVYLLEGDTDAGKRIMASISLGKFDFGTSAQKRVPNAFVGVASNGRMLLKVIVEGEEYIYVARDYDEELRTQRIDIGKGLKANFFEFELFNEDGEDFDLDSVEFVAVPLDRRS